MAHFKIDSYSKSYISDVGEYVKEEITAKFYKLLPLSGNAVVTHVGPNGLFKFVLNGVTYQKEFSLKYSK